MAGRAVAYRCEKKKNRRRPTVVCWWAGGGARHRFTTNPKIKVKHVNPKKDSKTSHNVKIGLDVPKMWFLEDFKNSHFRRAPTECFPLLHHFFEVLLNLFQTRTRSHKPLPSSLSQPPLTPTDHTCPRPARGRVSEREVVCGGAMDAMKAVAKGPQVGPL